MIDTLAFAPMHPQPAKRKKQYSLAILAIALSLQSCSANTQVATECVELKRTIRDLQPRFTGGNINKATETKSAKAEKTFADALETIDLSSPELQEKRDRLVLSLREAHTLSLKAADIMTEDGYLSGDAAGKYKDISLKRMDAGRQVLAEQNGLQIHCSS